VERRDRLVFVPRALSGPEHAISTLGLRRSARAGARRAPAAETRSSRSIRALGLAARIDTAARSSASSACHDPVVSSNRSRRSASRSGCCWGASSPSRKEEREGDRKRSPHDVFVASSSRSPAPPSPLAPGLVLADDSRAASPRGRADQVRIDLVLAAAARRRARPERRASSRRRCRCGPSTRSRSASVTSRRARTRPRSSRRSRHDLGRGGPPRSTRARSGSTCGGGFPRRAPRAIELLAIPGSASETEPKRLFRRRASSLRDLVT